MENRNVHRPALMKLIVDIKCSAEAPLKEAGFVVLLLSGNQSVWVNLEMMGNL